MFSFIKKYAESVAGIEVYPKIGLAIFLLVFIGMLLFALKANNSYIHELEQMPFNESGNKK